MDISNVLTLLGGVALFLFGMTLMGEGLKKVAGNKLELFLYRLTNTPLKGVLLGTGVTAIIQSSSATSVMVVGFVNSGMMQVRQAIGIILGAILGTSITGWIICLSELDGSGWVSIFSTSTLSAAMAIIGIVLRMFTKKTTNHHIGDILLGFAVLMYGMQSMSGAVAPLRSSEAFLTLITHFSNPLLGILAGTLFTAVLQSASAAVGILQALAATGAITFAAALPLIMGISIGACVPVLLSAVGAKTDGRRTAFAYLLISLIGVIVCGPVYYAVNAFWPNPYAGSIQTAVSIAALNTVFRLINVIILCPFLRQLESLLKRFIHDDGSEVLSAAELDRLDERFLEHPALAIEQIRETINAMARRSQESIESAMGLLAFYSPDTFAHVEDIENLVDRYEDKLGTYMVKLTGKEMTPRQSADVSKYLHTITDFERISDHALNIAQAAQEIHDKGIEFSGTGLADLDVISAAVTEILSIALDGFIADRRDDAYSVEPLEEVIDNLCVEIKLRHSMRLRDGKCTLANGFVYQDLLSNFERVADHCSNIAVAMIELAEDSFDTHEYLSDMRAKHSHGFDEFYAEYAKRYHLS